MSQMNALCSGVLLGVILGPTLFVPYTLPFISVTKKLQGRPLPVLLVILILTILSFYSDETDKLFVCLLCIIVNDNS